MEIHKIKNVILQNNKSVNTSDLVEITKDGLYYPLIDAYGKVFKIFITKEKVKEIINAFMEN